MDKSSNGIETPGVEDQFTVETVEKWLTRDVGAVISLMQAIHNDPNIRLMMAEYLHGVHLNRIQAVQAELALGKGPKKPVS